MRILSLCLLLVSQITYAALPPRYQNAKDLDVMVGFVKEHPLILSSLKSIDFEYHTIHYGNGCTAIFGREQIQKPQGWVGPADPLEFKKSTCKGL